MSKFLPALVSIALVLIVTSCVKIETGQTIDEAVESNEVRAKNMRAEWAGQLNAAADDVARAALVKMHIDSISALIIRYGYKVADEWEKGNEGRGVEIEAAEMRRVVNSWVAAQRPFLLAHEDNMEYGIKLVKETKKYNRFPDEAYQLLDSLAGHYYDTYSIIFYPNENADSYERTITAAERKHRELSDLLEGLIH